MTREAGPLTVHFRGPMGAGTPVPAGWPAILVERSEDRGFDGSQIVDLFVNIDWQGIANTVGIGLFTNWLYDQFKPQGPPAAEPEPVTVTITVDVRVVEVTVSQQEDLEQGLRAALGDPNA